MWLGFLGRDTRVLRRFSMWKFSNRWLCPVLTVELALQRLSLLGFTATGAAFVIFKCQLLLEGMAMVGSARGAAAFLCLTS